MSTNTPKVSIIIPAYNCDQYIADAIKSCTNQNYNNIEVLIINDGSTDNTQSVVESLLTDPRVLLFNQSNQGVSAARNLGLSKATGEYITFLDSDDTLAQGTIGCNVDVLLKNPDVQWLYFPIQRIDKDGNAVDEISPNLLPSYTYKRDEILTPGEAFDRMSNRLLPTCVCGAFYRHDFFDLEFQNGRYEDTIMVMELLQKNQNLMLSPYGSYEYYDRESSFINSDWNSEKWTSYVNVLLQIMHTRLTLFPDQRREIKDEKTKLYYKLRYLKSKNYKDKSFGKPLDRFLELTDKPIPSISEWCKYRIKTFAYLCLKFVTQR